MPGFLNLQTLNRESLTFSVQQLKIIPTFCFVKTSVAPRQLTLYYRFSLQQGLGGVDMLNETNNEEESGDLFVQTSVICQGNWHH